MLKAFLKKLKPCLVKSFDSNFFKKVKCILSLYEIPFWSWKLPKKPTLYGGEISFENVVVMSL